MQGFHQFSYLHEEEAPYPYKYHHGYGDLGREYAEQGESCRDELGDEYGDYDLFTRQELIPFFFRVRHVDKHMPGDSKLEEKYCLYYIPRQMKKI